ncbi:MAG: hypothetical protein ACOYXM_02485 [Actinomycetota bacterium]
MGAAVAIVLSSCSSDGGGTQAVLVRDPDDLQVLTPAEVEELRAETLASNERDPDAPAGAATDDTIPLEEVDPTERLFTAFGDFTGCMDDKGQPFRGDPRSDPALLEDKEYMDVIQTCAARSDILGALTAFQEFNDSLTPEQVEERNGQFVLFSECLEERGWEIEAAPNAKGLLTPSVFVGPDGTLNPRDLRQCGSDIDTNQ